MASSGRLAVGVFIASIGYHRERKFEKFSLIAWFRSVIIAVICGVTISVVTFPEWLYTVGLIVLGERTVSEFYKTYIKADYKPHVICKICRCNVYRIHGKFLRPRNAPTRLERKLTILSR